MVKSLAVALPMLTLAACVTTRLSPPVLAALDCSRLVPASYAKPVPPTPMPGHNATAGDLWKALDGQTTQLDQANGRTADLIAIAGACQAQQVAVLKALAPPRKWWQVF